MEDVPTPTRRLQPLRSPGAQSPRTPPPVTPPHGREATPGSVRRLSPGLVAAARDADDEAAAGVTLLGQKVAAYSRKVAEGAPPARFGHTSVVHGDTLVLFGGRDVKCWNDVWLYSFATKTWREAAIDSQELPIPRAGHTAVVHDGKMYVFGGVAARGGVHNWWLNDLWALDLTSFTWSHLFSLSCRWPEPRKGHTAAVHNRRMYVFGGGQDDTAKPASLFNDLWEYDLDAERWTACDYTGTIPLPRMYHVSALREGGRLVLFGGRADTPTGFLNDVHELDLEAMRARELLTSGVAPPAQRMCSTAVYLNGVLAVFTGGAFSYFEDSHQLCFDTMRWTQVSPALDFGGRTRPTTARCGNTLLTFGGCVTGDGYVNDQVEIELEPLSLREHVLKSLVNGGAPQHLASRMPRRLAVAFVQRTLCRDRGPLL